MCLDRVLGDRLNCSLVFDMLNLRVFSLCLFLSDRDVHLLDDGDLDGGLRFRSGRVFDRRSGRVGIDKFLAALFRHDRR